MVRALKEKKIPTIAAVGDDWKGAKKTNEKAKTKQDHVCDFILRNNKANKEILFYNLNLHNGGSLCKRD